MGRDRPIWHKHWAHTLPPENAYSRLSSLSLSLSLGCPRPLMSLSASSSTHFFFLFSSILSCTCPVSPQLSASLCWERPRWWWDLCWKTQRHNTGAIPAGTRPIQVIDWARSPPPWAFLRILQDAMTCCSSEFADSPPICFPFSFVCWKWPLARSTSEWFNFSYPSERFWQQFTLYWIYGCACF